MGYSYECVWAFSGRFLAPLLCVHLDSCFCSDSEFKYRAPVARLIQSERSKARHSTSATVRKTKLKPSTPRGPRVFVTPWSRDSMTIDAKACESMQTRTTL